MDIINKKIAMASSTTSPQRRIERKGATTDHPSRICSYCKKRESVNARSDQKLKRCARCRSNLYCSRVCQRADWKKGHQRTCIAGSITARNSSYLDSLPTEENVMDQLIDAYRLRVEDERMYCGRLRGRYASSTDTKEDAADPDSNCQALQSALEDFRNFLDLAESTDADNNKDHEDTNNLSSSPSSSNTNDTDTDNSSTSTTSSSSTTKGENSILPKWWNAEKRALCEQRAMQETNAEIWSNLHHPAGKDDILGHYRDNLMPMKLRMLAERVYGSDVMGQPR